MEEDTDLPPGLCCACSDAAITAFQFRRLCLDSSANWRLTVDSLSQIQDPSIDDKAYYVVYKYNEGVQTIVKDQLNRIKNKYDTIALAVERLKANPTVLSEPTKEKVITKKRCKCPDCGKVFASPYYLNQHLKTSSKRACVHCGAVILKLQLESHLFSHGMLVVACQICSKLFDNNESLESHIKVDHDDPTNSKTCNDCGLTCTNARGLRTHMMSHSLLHCNSCNLSYENRKCYKHHQKNCKTKNKIETKKERKWVYICDECGAKYDKKPSLKMHIVQKHLRILPYQCQTCGKKTSTLAHMRSHQAVHTKNRPVYMCHCGAQMRTVVGYEMHLRLHSGEKPYQCSECGESFLSASRRLDHIKRRHQSVKDLPHACTMCAARFIRPFELKKHYMAVHYTEVDVKPAKRRLRALFYEESLCPPGACISCTSAVIAAQEFKILVRSSHDTWTKAVKCLDNIQIDNSEPIKSVYAIIKKDNVSDLSLRIIKDDIPTKKQAVVNRINKINYKVSFKKAERKPRLARTGPPCDCVDCGMHFLSPYYLNLHLKNSGQKDACVICGAIVTRGQGMKDHLHTAHKQISYLCSNCPALFAKEVDYKNHHRTAHKTGVLTCGDCGRTFARSGAFEAHSQMHAVRTCRSCGSQFTNRTCYRKHRSKCEPTAKPETNNLPRSKRSNNRDPATFICDYCNKTYTSRPQLKNHIVWIHMDVRPHQCQWCEKRFYTPARLAEHTVVHTRERNFECDICGVRLVSKMAAVYHRRRHTGERPYECEDCGDRFISASRRSEHAKRRHNKGPRLQCKFCIGTFVRSHELRKHVEKAHRGQEVDEEKQHDFRVKDILTMSAPSQPAVNSVAPTEFYRGKVGTIAKTE